ncbi:gliding motility-associated C-terminal domain-containing protein [Flavobacterium endoglycinae]|uniref:Gliding motility-associated C-terminal domain-containing protein n=1 Tax=Flavobacterium endoglycinae TaxID=2816357 RepID=A0ABX7QI60_9FLAO|nr:gliding motility-associated C-terminal domain-containing protein [Flavobacterium endoglycinae]QSW90622.1 gliding motility-associated C-terminal domain-containing protein [Flavobacterium endoglycinae]
MRNFTFSWFKSSKPNFLVLFFLLLGFTASAQFYTKHYIAPAPWQYFSKANEIVIATNSTSTVNIVLAKSDGTVVANLTAVKGTPAVYRFTGLPSAAKPFALNTVLNAAGLIVTGTAPVSINLRNVASDALGGDGSDQDIKGNAALTSFGDAGLGIRFRVGYYRDGSLGNFGGLGDQRPIYSIMATVNNTVVKINNVVTATLNAGQSYLFKAAIGTLVESSNPAVMNTSAAIDTPGGCGDSAYNQLPPEAVLGTEYFLERGTGNNTAEQTTVVATKDNTTVTIESYTTTGTLSSTNTITLAQAGNFYTFVNGVSNTNFTASHIIADKRVAVYSGTAQNCEVDISTIAPVSECGGSNFIETAKFRDYNSGTLDYFGYILLRSATDVVTVNGTNIATISGVGARYQVGSTGWYLINFNSVQIGSPNVLSIASNSKLTVSIVQQSGGFSMAGFFSNFAVQPEDPTVTYISGGGCTNSSATLTTPSGFAPYQWYYNGTAITGANSDTYTATKTGSYSVSSTLACGSLTQSKPVSVTLCTDLGVTNTVDNATPCVNSNVEFTVKVSNLGLNNATGVSLNDLLPSGYTYSSSTVSVGAYNSTTGVWSIGDLDPSAVATLKIIATVNATGSHNTTASLPASTPDSNTANNSASVSTTPKAITVALALTGSTICVSPGGNGTITSSTSASGVNYQLYNSSNTVVQTAKAGTGSALTWSGLAAGTGYYVIGTNTSTSCSSTSNTVNVATTANPTALGLTGSTICVSPGGDGTITSSTSVSGVNYQLFNASNTAVQASKSGTGAALTWSGLTAANGYYVIATNAANCTATSNTVNVSTKANPVTPTLSSVTQPTCSTATGSFTITNYDSNNTYAVTPSAGVTRTGNTVTAPAGSYTLTASANGCTSSSSSAAVVNAQPATPAVPTLSSVTQPTCSTATGSFTITNYDSNNTYAVTPSAGVTRTGNTVTAPAGSYTITASANGCTSSSSSAAVVNAQPATPAVPTLSSVTQPTCSTATGSFTITNYDSNNTYAVTPSAGVTRTGNTVTAPAGSYTLTASANGCTSSSSSAAAVNAQPATPAVPTLSSVTQPTCSTATGSFTITNYDSNNTYTVTPSAGVTRTGNTVTAPAGSYTLTASANGCTSSSSSAAAVNAQPATPAVPTLSSVTQPTCSTATGSFTITNYDSNNTYTVTPSAGVTRTGNTVTAPAGSYTLTASTNGCTSSSSSVAAVNAQPATPAVPTLSSVTQPTCSTATGSFTITNYDSNNTYTVTPSAGVTRTGNTVTAPAGSYTLTASANGCTSSSSSSAVVNAQPATPAVPTLSSVTQPTCSTATGSFTITNYDSNNTYTVTPSAGVTRTGNTVTAPAGSYTLTASANGCTSGSTTIVVNSILCANTDNSYAQQASGSTIITVGNVTTNDTLNGAAVTSTNTDVTPKTTGPLSVDADGVLTLAANTVSGTYTITYEICETGANPANCKTADATVEVKNNLIANIDTVSSILASNISQTLAINVFTNDTKNGTALNPSDVNLTTSVADPKGYLTLNADGTVTLGANAPADTYELTYTICEKFATSNCSSNVVRVTVDTPVIDAVTETTASVNGNTGGTTAPLTANDTLNGNPAVIGTAAGNVKLTGISVPSGLTLNADGTVTVAANTPAGIYDVEYSICEITNPSNCDAVISKVVVDAAVIDAVTETTASVNGNAGGTTAPLTANDTLNGNPVVIGTAAGNVKLTGISVPSGLTLNADGTVTAAPNTPAGTYDVEYSICEITNPSNCDAVISKVVVDAAVIDAVTETTAAVNGNTGGTTASLTANDTLNGNPVVIGTAAGNVKLTGISVPSGLTLNAHGTVTAAPNTPAGTYDVEYQICEITNPSNCDAVVSQVVVDAAVIDAVTETTASVNGNTGGTTASLTVNDTLNGNPAVIGTAAGNVKLTGISVPSGLTLNADGTVTVAPNTPEGNYSVEYSICEITNPSNCDAVISTVLVSAGTLIANADIIPSVTGLNTPQTLGTNVFTNDTKNGTALNPSDVTLAVSTPDPKGYLTLNPDGTLTIGANPPAGTYELTYTICEKLNPGNCSSNTVTVTVGAPVIDAVTETTAAVNGNTGGTTASLTVNDTLNGNPVVIGTAAGNVKLTAVNVPSGLTLNADGTVTVAPNTPSGTYDVEYQICEITNPSNCDAVISKVVVDAAVIDAVTETTAAVNGNAGGTTASLTVNDTLNGNPVVIGTAAGNVKLTAVNVPSGLTLNADGTVTVAPNTPAGTYDVEYSICEITNPSNCDAVISKVVVDAAVIDAVTETTAAVNGNTGGTTASLTANDTLNGNPVVIGTAAGNVKLNGISVPSGLTLNADGTVTVAANTPAGTYDVEYSICEITNPSNCDAVVSKVVVDAAVIDAVTETTVSVNGNTGGTTASLTANDTLNGNPVVIGTAAGNVKLTAVNVPSGLTLNADGTVTVAPNTPAGTYDVEYSICEITNPSNCDAVISKVVVDAAVIDAVTETTAAVNGNTGGTTASLTANDTLNGNPVVIGTAAGNVKLTAVNVPSGLTLNADGTVTVAPNTPAGTYDVEYSICEIMNPSNCDAVISKVVVDAAVIDAVTETTAAVNGNTGGTTASLTANDTLNGNPVVIGTAAGNVKLTVVNVPSGLTLNADGTVTVAANTPAGTYDVEYSICEITNPSNCDAVVSKVVVDAAVIDAVTETTASVNGNTGGTTAPLTANDTLNGNPVVIGTAAGNVKLTGISVPSGLTLNADGTVTVAPNTPAGNYSIEYSICEITNPSNCDAVISTVPVSAGTLIANADIIPSVTGSNTPQTLGTNVFTNDTKNGTALNPSDVTLAVSTPDPKGYLTLNPDGTLTLGANPPAGTYELTYTICEKLNPGNCSSNTVTVTVGAPVIDAVTETTASVNGNTGGTTAPLTANDTLNGNPIVIGTAAGNVKLTAVNVPSGLTLNADGTVTVAPNTPSGTYDVEYQICEITNPSNCDAVISTVPVSAGTLIANADIIPSVTGSNTPQTLGTNVFTNDTKNGTALNPSDITLAVSTPDPKGYLILNPDGTLTLGANPPAGTYELTYTICEKLNPGNCSSNTVTVTVGAPVIDAVTETTAAVNGNAGGTTASLTANDTLNGNPVVIGTAAGNVKLTGISVPSGLTLNADGTVTVAPNTPAGNYSVEYSICEITNPSNCDAVISTVPVSAGTLIANADIIPSVTGSNTPQTLGTNVFTNDTKNGTALNPSDVTLAVSTPDPKGYLTLNPDGTLTLGANAPAGTYELTYTICEKLNPGNCSSNTVTVTVAPPVIDAVAETLAPSISGSTGGTTTSSVIAGDTLNGVQAVIGTNNGQVKLTGINIPAGFTLNADGTVTVGPNTPAGIYDIQYSICEITNPTNCDTAISKVVVNAPAGGTLQAVPDVVASVVGINQPQTVINIFNNDLNNGLPLVPADVNLTIITPDPTGYLTLNPDGTVTLAPNTPRGTYELVYQICEKANPSNCSSASVKVTVEEPTMTITANSYCSNNVPYVNYSVVPDNFTAANLLTIKWIDSANNVVATQVNQPLSGTILWPGATVDANGNGTDWPGWVLTNGQWAEGADGFENTRPAVRMEFSLNPTETVSVTYPLPSGQCNAKPTFTIQANNDSAAAVDATKGLSTGINVFNNDTLNGVKVNPADVILSTVLPNANLILNADGTVDVKAGTPSGMYQLTYQICEAANTSNCSQATVNVVVQNSGTPVNPTLPLVLTDDVLVSVDGINGSLEFVNVLDNDLLNGQPINPIDVIITNLSGDSNFEFNADGTVNVKPNTPGKTYDLVYQVCEKANPTNCSTAVVHVFVEVPAIAIIKTAVFNDENNNNNADPGETITYKFEVTNTGNVPLKGVTISDPLPGVKVSGDAIDLAVGESNNTNFSAVYKITQTDINNEKVTNQASVKGNSARGVVVEDISDDEGLNGDKPTVTSLKGCEIRVLNAFSPNGDQKNERFYIQGIGCYPDNTVEIYNRWGVLVFEKDGYNNEDRVFKGYSEGRTTMKQSEGLPVGTYFYILKYKDSGSNAHEKSGYLYINK